MARGDLEGNETAIYRAFDGDGVLLYVGITKNPDRRIGREHRKNSRWYADAHYFDIRVLASREVALFAEAAAITREVPSYYPVFEDRYYDEEFVEPEPLSTRTFKVDRSGLFD